MARSTLEQASRAAFEAMQKSACRRLLGVHLVRGAGHSVAEEQPDEVNRLLIEFLQQAKSDTKQQ
jgi:pimeloyl-ACP methyl ester carboxylesterase